MNGAELAEGLMVRETASDMTLLSLLAAVREGEVERIRTALAADPDLITAVDAEGMTLLHWAVAASRRTVLAELLAHAEAPLDAPQWSHGRTPLHMAAIKGAPDLIRLLLEDGANVFAVDTGGLRPLDVAGTPAAVAALRQPTLYPDRALREAIQAGAVLRARRQLAACPQLKTAADADGRTPLHQAVGAGCLPMVETLVADGVPIDKPDRSGRTPLHEAVRRGDIILTRALLSMGADPHATDHQGITPLHFAAGYGDATRPLSLPPPYGLAPAIPAAARAATGQGAFDFDALTATPSPAPAPAPSSDDAALATALLDAGADVNARARGGVTALHLAADAGDAGLVSLLLARGAVVDPVLAPWNATPAHLAVVQGHDTVVEMLSRAGADLMARDNYGRAVADFGLYIERGSL